MPSSSEEWSIPAKVPGLQQIRDVACGNWHVLALDVQGAVFSCGSNKHGELGREGAGEGFHQIEAFDGKVKSITAGFGVSFFVCEENERLHSFGSNNLSLQKEDKRVPTLVKNFNETVKQVDCAPTYAALITTDGQLYTWGGNLCQ